MRRAALCGSCALQQSGARQHPATETADKPITVPPFQRSCVQKGGALSPHRGCAGVQSLFLIAIVRHMSKPLLPCHANCLCRSCPGAVLSW
jgi:hypothetical protein